VSSTSEPRVCLVDINLHFNILLTQKQLINNIYISLRKKKGSISNTFNSGHTLFPNNCRRKIIGDMYTEIMHRYEHAL